MQWSIDAIFANGVFKPVQPVRLREQERVHLEVRELLPDHAVANGAANAPTNGHLCPQNAPTTEGHRRLIEHLRASPGYDLGGKYPARDELYEA